MYTDFGVHLNGNFSLSSARNNVLESDFLQANCDNAKWNQYILYDILPDLHVKLLEHVLKFEKDRHKKDKINFISHDLWPIKDSTTNLYKNYGLSVIIKLGLDGYRILWTKAKGGQFILLQTAKFLKKEKKGTNITNILANLGISVIELDEYKLKHLEKARIKDPIFEYTSLDEKLVCKELKELDIHIDHNSLFKLLDFILKDKSSYETLTGLLLVLLYNGSVEKFGEAYYVTKK